MVELARKERKGPMVRINIHLPPNMHDALLKIKKEKGYDVAECIRLAVNQWLQTEGEGLPLKIPKSLQAVATIYKIIHDMLPQDTKVTKIELDWEMQLSVFFQHWYEANNAVIRACSIMRMSGTEIFPDAIVNEVDIPGSKDRTRLEKVGFDINFQKPINQAKFHEKMNIAMKNAINKTTIFASFALNNSNTSKKGK